MSTASLTMSRSKQIKADAPDVSPEQEDAAGSKPGQAGASQPAGSFSLLL